MTIFHKIESRRAIKIMKDAAALRFVKSKKDAKSFQRRRLHSFLTANGVARQKNGSRLGLRTRLQKAEIEIVWS